MIFGCAGVQAIAAATRSVVCWLGGSPVSGDSLRWNVSIACRNSGGTGYRVSDEARWEAHQRLAREEGIFCEPAGAVALAGALDAVQRGEIDHNAPVVCTVTGSGFKDPPSVDRMIQGVDCPSIEAAEIMDV